MAFLFHRPGLKLLCGERVAPALRRQNAAALAATGLAVAAAGLLAPPGKRGVAALGAWLVGHVLWGAWLAASLRR